MKWLQLHKIYKISKICIILLFSFLAFAENTKISRDPLNLYDAFSYNRILKSIEAQQKKAKENTKAPQSLFFIQRFESTFLQALLKYPENTFLHYNLGVFFFV